MSTKNSSIQSIIKLMLRHSRFHLSGFFLKRLKHDYTLNFLQFGATSIFIDIQLTNNSKEMLTNFSIAAEPQKIADQFSTKLPENYKPTFNACPTQELPIITSANPETLTLVHWGSTEAFSKSKSVSDKLLFARVEDIQTKSSLKKNFASKRCVILADSFYAWKEIAKKEKVPYRFSIGDNEVFAIAGLWDSFEDDNGETVNTFMMITTPASSTVQDVSDRMPAILNEDLLIEWLNEDTKDDSLLEFIKPYKQDDLSGYTINPKLSDPNFNSEALWKRVPPANQFGNLTLFN